jgi:LacI family transcriptional regulator, repressor for deo operon, udp, cdd, tsx, nupC, and nupG
VSSRLSDIAAQAGVSTATVSRVLNNRAGVAEATRQAVLTAVGVLGYERPAFLRSRSVGLVGVLIPELDNPVFPLFAQVIESGLAQWGYTSLLCTRAPGWISEEEYIDLLLEHGVAGIIFVSGVHADTTADVSRYPELRKAGLPLVFVNGFLENIDGTFLSTDDLSAMDLAVRHLVELGHTRIGLAIGPDRYVPTIRKIAGFQQALSRRLGEADAGPVAVTLYTVEGGHAAAVQLLDAGCTGIVCGSDLMALGAIRAARVRGLDVPQDVSVIGYDDSLLMSFTDPPLTTIRQSVSAMGGMAVQLLVEEIAGRVGPRTEMLFAPELVVRGSTGSGPTVRSARSAHSAATSKAARGRRTSSRSH